MQNYGVKQVQVREEDAVSDTHWAATALAFHTCEIRGPDAVISTAISCRGQDSPSETADQHLKFTVFITSL